MFSGLLLHKPTSSDLVLLDYFFVKGRRDAFAYQLDCSSELLVGQRGRVHLKSKP